MADYDEQVVFWKYLGRIDSREKQRGGEKMLATVDPTMAVIAAVIAGIAGIALFLKRNIFEAD